jgi:hypothetical protein
MDEHVEKAFQTANYMATLNNQRNVAFEEFQQSLIHYINGSSFQISLELMTFVKSLIDSGNLNCILIDINQIPVNIENLKGFYEEISAQYFKASNEYFSKYSELKSKRRIQDLISV